MTYEFKGNDRVIVCSKETDSDVETINVQTLYSKWKDWLLSDIDNLKYTETFKIIGGDKLTIDQRISIYVELINDWRIEPEDGNYQINVVGNLFAEGGESPFRISSGNSITINMNTSSNALIIDIGRGDTPNKQIYDQITSLKDDLFNKLKVIDTMVNILLDIEQGNWEIKDKQMIFYTRNGVELMKFNLYDRNNKRTNLNPFRRERI